MNKKEIFGLTKPWVLFLSTLGGLVSPSACAEQRNWVFKYDRPTTDPIVFSGMSRAADAKAVDYCLWLDIWYDNGENVWGRRADFRGGTHDWEVAKGVFVPTRPVTKIEMFALFREHGKASTKGRVEFRDVKLERRAGRGETFPLGRMTLRPFENAELEVVDVFEGERVERSTKKRAFVDAPVSPIPSGEVRLWCADSMRAVTPLTFPTPDDPRSLTLSLARRERESAQLLLSSASDCEWTHVMLELPELKRSDGTPFRGDLKWERQGYLAREFGANPHPNAFSADETWFPNPLLPPAPMRVRRASTQGAWITVHAAPDAAAGTYIGEIRILEKGEERGRIPMTVCVDNFSLPRTFGMETAYALMDGYIRKLYPNDFKAKKREAIDMMLDHRLNPDDISRTSLPEIEDLLYARSRGMNRFNILNVVPPKLGSDCVLYSKPEEVFNPDFERYFFGKVKSFVQELHKHGLDKLAYVYGFDERTAEFYPGIDTFWKKLHIEVPGIPLMTTAFNYRDLAKGRTGPGLVTGDWYCPLTSDYNLELSDRLRSQGKKVWWYVCCGPGYPYANFASWEYPPIEGRLLGWMTWKWRADGFLFWIVNKWNRREYFDERETFFPDYRTYNSNGMPGDGILIFPGERHLLASTTLAQCRDAVEDYEYLQLAAAAVGRAEPDAVCAAFIRSLVDYSRSPEDIRSARRRLTDIICSHCH